MSDWISVEDREPKDGDWILAFDGSYHVAQFSNRYPMGNYRYDCDTYDVKPTHWMPLPEPPKTNV